MEKGEDVKGVAFFVALGILDRWRRTPWTGTEAAGARPRTRVPRMEFGSGGAVVALCPDGEAQAELLHKACQEAGFVVQQIKVAPSVLSDEELTSLSTC